MKSYYKILDVKVLASNMEIKKGYFSMVRKYPLDRFPHEFMEIREAYEFLSNDRTKNGAYSRAIPLLENATKEMPDILMILSLLGETYRNNENSGKVVKML